LDDERVSGDHALLRWEYGAWVVQDLSSTNGVFLHGERLPVGQATPLDEGARLGFGTSLSAWELVDGAPPSAYAESLAGERRPLEDGRIALPDETSPQYVISATSGQGWVLQDSRGARRVRDGEQLGDGSTAWVLHLPELLPRTLRTQARRLSLRECTLVVRVSQDQENVEMTLRADGAERRLGTAAYGYVVVDLVDRRASDVAAGIAPTECGWAAKAELERVHRLGHNQLNVWLHRFRRSVSEAGVEDGESVVETRDRGRLIRLGVAGRRDG
jgi:hypothetical protein